MTEFKDIASFAKHLAAAAVAVEVAERRLLDQIGKQVKKRAKDKIGEYQDQAGPFAGWAELADSTKDDRLRQGYTENDPGLRSGEMRDSIGHTVRSNQVTIGSDDDKLVYFELGTEKQPPRSVLGGAMVEELPVIKKAIGGTMTAALVGKQVYQGTLAIED